MPPAPLARSGKSQRTTDSPITYFIQKALENPALISFAAGLVDEGSFPVDRGRRRRRGDRGRSQPAARPRSSTARHRDCPNCANRSCATSATADGVDRRDLNLSPADVVITTGSQQLLYLLGELFIDPGDIVITEAPSYFVYHSLLQSHGARVLTVPMDENGMRMDALEALLERLEAKRRAGAGEAHLHRRLLPEPDRTDAERRPAARSWSNWRRRFSTHHRILILEDAAYRELRYSGDGPPERQAVRPAERVRRLRGHVLEVAARRG